MLIRGFLNGIYVVRRLTIDKCLHEWLSFEVSLIDILL